MKRSRKQVHHGGIYKPNWINITACGLLLLYNGLDFFIKDVPVITLLIYMLPFVIILFSSLFVRSRYTDYFVYLFVGIVSISLDNEHSGVSGLLYMFFAYSELRTVKSLLLLILSSFVALSLRFIRLDVSGINIVTPIFIFVFIMLTFYVKVILPFKNKGIKQPSLSERERNILKLYTRGYSYEQINHELRLNIDKHSIRKIITRVRDQSGCINDIQFGKWLYEKG